MGRGGVSFIPWSTSPLPIHLLECPPLSLHRNQILKMKLLHVILSLCVVNHIFASGDVVAELDEQDDSMSNARDQLLFETSIMKDDMGAAIRVFRDGDSEVMEFCVKHLVKLGDPKLVIELVNNIGYFDKSQSLRVFLAHADQPMIEDVLNELKPSNDILELIACNADLACQPDKFLYFLSKITDKATQEGACASGIYELFAHRIECINPLLDALELQTSLSADLFNIAVRTTFKKASHIKGLEFWIRRFFDHPAVPATIYSDALYYFHDKEDPSNDDFYWLLARADFADLGQVIFHPKLDIHKKPPEFQQAVYAALQVVGLATRPGMGRLAIIEAIRNAIGALVPSALLNLIAEYNYH